MRLTTWSVTPPHLVGPNFVRPCSGHAKRRKRQEHAGRRTCSRGDGERGARRIRRGGSTRHDIEISRLEAEGIWLAIIDTAATNNALALRAIAKADLCLLSVRPCP